MKFHNYDEIKDKTDTSSELSVENKEFKRPDNWQPVSAISIDLTEGCSLRCTYCFCDTEAEKKEGNVLDVEVGKRAIDLLLSKEFSGDLQEVTVEWWGGEPFTQFPKIKQLAEYAKEKSNGTGKKVKFGATTNIVSLTEDKVQWMIDNNLYALFSVDGRGERNKERLLKGSLKNSWEIIETKIPFISKMYKDNNWTPTFRMTITPTNVVGLCEDYIWFNEMGYGDVMISENHDANWTKETMAIYEKELTMIQDYRMDKFINHNTFYPLKRLDNSFQYKMESILGTAHHRAEERKHPCGAGRTYMGISVEGGIYPCHIGKTLVKTNKGYKEIQNILENEKVMTHNCQYKRVTKKWEKQYTGDMYRITPYNFNIEIEATPEHPLYIMEGKECKWWGWRCLPGC